MKSLKKVFPFIVTLIITVSVQSQDLLRLVPKNAVFVGMINVQKIDSKARLNELLQLPLIQKIDKEMNKKIFDGKVSADTSNYLDLKKYGIEANSKSYAYYVNGEKIQYGALLLSLNNKEKFTDFVKTLIKDYDEVKIEGKNNYSYVQNRDLNIIWNNNTAAVFGASLVHSYRDSINKQLHEKYEIKYEDYEYNDYDYVDSVLVDEQIEIEEAPVDDEMESKAYNDDNDVDSVAVEEIEIEPLVEEKLKIVTDDNQSLDEDTIKANFITYDEFYRLEDSIAKSIEIEWMEQNGKRLLNDLGTNSFASNSEFQDFIKTNPDAAALYDYGVLVDLYMRSLFGFMSSMSLTRYPYMAFWSIYSGMKIYSKINFNKDEIELDVYTKYSPLLKDILSKSKKKNIPKKYLNYLDKNLLGYSAFSVDFETAYHGTKEMLKKQYGEIEEYGKIISTSIDIADIIIDEKAICNVFTGDFVFALNGITEHQVIHTTYDYDEEFNYVERMDTSMQTMPDFVFMAGVGNKNDVQKLIDIMIYAKALEKEGNYYSLTLKKKKFPVYFRIYDDIFFVSNNKAGIQNPNLFANNGKLDKEHIKMFKKNTLAGFVNTAEISRYFAEKGFSNEKAEMINATGKLFRSIKFYSEQKGDLSKSKYILNLSNSEDNSIVDIIKYFNTLYLIDTKKI